jgi:hypothetical protein
MSATIPTVRASLPLVNIPRTRQQHDTRVRIGQRRRRDGGRPAGAGLHQLTVAVRLEVRRVLLDEAGDRLARRLDDGSRRRGIGERDVAGQALRVDRVIRRGGADLREARRLGSARQLPDVVPVVEAEDDPPLAAEQAAERGRHLARHAPPRLRVGRGHRRRPEDPPAPRGVAEVLLRPRHQLDRREVRLPERRPPRAEPVLLETIARAAGCARMAAQTSFESPKPGRR